MPAVTSISEPKSILITGASSGIGAALALAYAAPGIDLALSGRDRARLDDITTACRAAGAQVDAQIIDVADRAAMAAWIAGIDAAAPLDLVIANAGISGKSGSGEGTATEEQQVRDIFAVNMDGVLNTIWPVIPAMRGRGRGQLALLSSVAGLRGLPSAPAYSASKAAVLAYGDGLRGTLSDAGIAVSVICPGFVVSRITNANTFAMPFLMPADKAAAIIKRGLKRRKPRIGFPWQMYWAARLVAMAPSGLADAILRRGPRKE